MLTYPCHIVLQIRHLEILGAGLSFVPEIFLNFFLEALGFFQRFDFCFNLNKIATTGYKFSCSLDRTRSVCLSEFLLITLTLKLTMGK